MHTSKNTATAPNLSLSLQPESEADSLGCHKHAIQEKELTPGPEAASKDNWPYQSAL